MFQGGIRPTGGVLRSQFQEIVQLLPFSLQVLQSGYKAMFWKPHPSSTGNPTKFVTPVGCPNGEGIALGESKGANGAMAADGGAEGTPLLQFTLAQVQRALAAVCAQPPEGAVQVARLSVRTDWL